MTRTGYIGGSTVRPLEEPIRRERLNPKQVEEQRKQNARKRAVMRNRSRAMKMSRGYVGFLTLSVLVIGFFCVKWVQIQSDVSTRMRNVATLQSQVNNLRADNDERYKRITTSVDISRIKDTAINELGMCYPAKEQVVYFTIENNNFMDQYSDIPKQ